MTTRRRPTHGTRRHARAGDQKDDTTRCSTRARRRAATQQCVSAHTRATTNDYDARAFKGQSGRRARPRARGSAAAKTSGWYASEEGISAPLPLAHARCWYLGSHAHTCPVGCVARREEHREYTLSGKGKSKGKGPPIPEESSVQQMPVGPSPCAHLPGRLHCAPRGAPRVY